MSFRVDCPLPAALTAIPGFDCPTNYGQIQKLAFRLKAARNSVSATTGFQTIADLLNKSIWTAAIAATSVDKIVVTPYINNFVIPENNPITQGGNDNTTIDGIPEFQGFGSTTPTGQLRNAPASVVKSLNALTGFSLNNSLEVFLINEFGNIIYDASAIDEDGDGIPYGFDVANFAVGPDSHAGFNAPKVNALQFSFYGRWSDSLAIANVTVEGTPAPWNARQLVAA